MTSVKDFSYKAFSAILPELGESLLILGELVEDVDVLALGLIDLFEVIEGSVLNEVTFAFHDVDETGVCGATFPPSA